VIFVHGVMGKGNHFRATKDVLPEFTTVTYDRRGYAASTLMGTGHETYEDHASDLVDLIVANSTNGATVIGHSHGGGIALLAAVRQPDVVQSVGLWEPLLGWLSWWDPYPRQAATSVSEMSNAADIAKDIVYHTGLNWDALSPGAREKLIEQGPAYQADMRASLHAPFDLADVQVPVLVGIGSHGMPHACGPAPRLSSELGARLIEYDAGHDIQRDAPQLLAEFVRAVVEAAA
jgi:pimeloyl-ACP methyl ester carboxylesterase